MFQWLNNIFNWFNKNIESVMVNNYKLNDDGCIEIKVGKDSWLYGSGRTKNVLISKSSIISHTKDNIIHKDCNKYFNCDFYESIEFKINLIEYEETRIKIYEYFREDGYWKHTKTDITGTKTISEMTPLEVFRKGCNSKYKLIETEEEFNQYLASALDCDTWCRKKLYDKMKELGLGEGFINQFADLVGNDLDKYYAMIDLANEVSDKDTLMYLYTYKFREE